MKVRDFLKHPKNYLPDFMHDWHSQKDVFKVISIEVEQKHKRALEGDNMLLLNWIKAHIYVVDFFLRFMAMHGYVLQRSRRKVEFLDIERTLNDFRQMQFENHPIAEKIRRETNENYLE